MPTRRPASSRLSIAAFLTAQLMVAAVVIGTAYAKHRQEQQRLALPQLRNMPLTIEPLYDDPRVVTDEQLRRVLYNLRPRLRGERPKINYVDHALRCWGVESKFADPECLSGEEMRKLLTDHATFAGVWGAEEPPFLAAGPGGIRVRTKDGNATASHVDHTLAGLAEVGTPLDFQLQTTAGPATQRDMLIHSLRSFSLNQGEYEWSALAYALYFANGDPWISSEGQQITFDRIARRIMRQRLREGVCYGNHRLHALVVFLRVDDVHPILSPLVRQEIVAHLQSVTAALIQSQHPYGYWDGNWPDAEAAGESDGSQDDKKTMDSLSSRLLATGHALEWWSLAPAEVQPPREVVVRAGQWLAVAIGDMGEDDVDDKYTFLTHAGRALALWRGQFPSAFAESLEPPGSTR